MNLYKKSGSILVVCLVFLQCTCKKNNPNPCTGDSCNPTPKSFTLFNAIHYNQTPDLNARGVHSFTLVYANHLTSPDPNNPTDMIPNPDSIRAVAGRLSNSPNIPVCLDIESWSYSSSQLPVTINRYLQVMDDYRQVNQNSGIGYYGVVPKDAFIWSNIQPAGSPNYVKWQQLNTALSPIADSVDYFYPSFYAFDNDTASWHLLVNATLDEIRKYNRGIPIYAFVWPQYHNGQPLQFQFVDTTVWRYELETLYGLTDGIVIWSSNKDVNGNVITWDESMPWWQVTQSFIQEHGIQ